MTIQPTMISVQNAAQQICNDKDANALFENSQACIQNVVSYIRREYTKAQELKTQELIKNENLSVSVPTFDTEVITP